MDGKELCGRIERAERPLGPEQRFLRLADRVIRIEGLDFPLVELLARRWGPFIDSSVAPGLSEATRINLVHGGDGHFVPRTRGELYRIEAVPQSPRRIVASYNFAVSDELEGDGWRLALADDSDERLERVVDNAVRFVVARLAVDLGGFALHAAGVAHRDRAWLLAGPSRSGKSTAVRMADPAVSLGDDFALVVPTRDGWSSAATPFDNSEEIVDEPPAGWIPIAGIWRLFPAPEARVELLTPSRELASLMGCLAFPWTMPECGDRLLAHAGAYIEQRPYRHLHFRLDTDLWTHLVGGS